LRRLPLVRIRYCGGCNPEIERREIVEQLMERFTGRVNWTYDPETPADLTLHVCGCAHACLDEEEAPADPPRVVSIQGLRVDRRTVGQSELVNAAAEALSRILGLGHYALIF